MAGWLAIPLTLAACSNAEPDADTQTAAPETVASAPALPTDISTLTRDDFAATLAPDYLVANMDSDDAETALQSWLDTLALEEGTPTTSLRKRFDMNGRTVLVASAANLSDDSVSAQQVYAEFTPIGPLTNGLDFAGLRVKCARGANTTDWQLEPCP